MGVKRKVLSLQEFIEIVKEYQKEAEDLLIYFDDHTDKRIDILIEELIKAGLDIDKEANAIFSREKSSAIMIESGHYMHFNIQEASDVKNGFDIYHLNRIVIILADADDLISDLDKYIDYETRRNN